MNLNISYTVFQFCSHIQNYNRIYKKIHMNDDNGYAHFNNKSNAMLYEFVD